LKAQDGTPEKGRRVAVLSNGVFTMGVITDVIGDGPYQIEIDFDHDNGPPVTHTFPDHRTGYGMFLFGNARAKQQAAIAAAAAARTKQQAAIAAAAAAMGKGSAVDEGGDVIEGDEHVFSLGEEVVAYCNFTEGGGDWFEAIITCVNSMKTADGVVERSYDVRYDDDGLTKILPPELIRLRDSTRLIAKSASKKKPTSKKKSKKKFVQEITVDRLTRIFTEGELEKSDPTMCDCGSVACSTWNEEINVCVECQEG
jgi:hypothetical protein